MISSLLSALAPISGGELLAVCVLLWFAICGGLVLGAAWGSRGHHAKLADLLAVMSHRDRTYVVDALERAADVTKESGEVR